MQVNMLEAKNQLSKLVKAVLAGEDVVIANHGKPMVRLVKLADQPKTRGYGVWKDQVEMAEDWDSPRTNAAIAARIVGNPIEPRDRVPVPGDTRAAKVRKRAAA